MLRKSVNPSEPHRTTWETCYIRHLNACRSRHLDRPPTTIWSSHALGSSSANVRLALPLRERGTVFLPIYAPQWTLEHSTRNRRRFYLANFIQFPIELLFCCIVIRLVGHCCKPQPSVTELEFQGTSVHRYSFSKEADDSDDHWCPAAA